MKVVFINAYDVTGGAAIAAHRLYRQLHEQFHTDNRMLAGTKRSNDPTVTETVPAGFVQFVERGTSFVFSRLGLQYAFIPYSAHTIESFIKRTRPDVIHLHNIHGGYFQTSLLRTLSRYAPMVWTLHDMWAFTANAAHTFGDESWKRMKTFPGERSIHPVIGLPTGEWLLKQKKKLYAQSNITIVTPSRWLHDLAIQSPVFEGKSIVHIPNGIDVQRFHPMDKPDIRRSMDIPVGAKVIFFSSEKIDRGDFKGGKILLDILRVVHDRIDETIHIIMIGAGGFPELRDLPKYTVHALGYMHDEESMIRAINAADLLLYPTKADNLPNVLIESIACGVPAVTFDIGGCSEVIVDQENGYVTPPFDKEMFATRTVEILKNDALRMAFSIAARKRAVEVYGISESASRYYNMYSAVSDGYKNR